MNSWSEFFNCEEQKDYYFPLLNKVKEAYSQKTCYPPFDLLFNAYKLTPLDRVKVVLIGQDPYHNPYEAMGLAFSVNPGVKLPPSLKNIYKEIENEFHTAMDYTSGDLTYLAHQGVFLLNSYLSVEEHKPLSHSKFGYDKLIENTLLALNDDDKPKVFLLWGNESKRYRKLITNPRHLVLESAHPSPLSAYQGFFNNQHFIKTNEYLLKNNLTPINWSNNLQIELF